MRALFHTVRKKMIMRDLIKCESARASIAVLVISGLTPAAALAQEAASAQAQPTAGGKFRHRA